MTLGRWVTRDPAGYVDGTSLYRYGRTRPTLFNDPSGLMVLGDTDPSYYEIVETDGGGYYYDAFVFCEKGPTVLVRHHYKWVGTSWYAFWNWGEGHYEFSHTEVLRDGSMGQRRGQDIYGCEFACYCDPVELVGFTAGEAVDWGQHAWTGQLKLWAAAVTIMVPGIDDAVIATGFMLLKGVRYVQIAGKWYKVTEKGTELVEDLKDIDRAIDSIPDEAYQVRDWCRAHNGTPPKKIKGNRPFENRDGALPEGTYKEYDIRPPNEKAAPGEWGKRGRERLVHDCERNIWYYTPDHYESCFYPLKEAAESTK